MTLHDVIVIIAALINLLAIGGFAWWIIGWIRSLKGAVDAQRETIAAQKQFIEGLKTVLDTADTPKMLERVEAYKKFVDNEKEALKASLERQLEEEKQRAFSQTSAAQNVAARLSDEYLTIIAALMPYVPHAERAPAINMGKFAEAGTRDLLHRLADAAPDFSHLMPFIKEGNVAERFFELLTKISCWSLKKNMKKEIKSRNETLRRRAPALTAMQELPF